ncbi:MAG: hypothetical protein WAJ85_02470, partial [Candidatus Baltobacteraceae bacterium]|jgi:hypothetical protein
MNLLNTIAGAAAGLLTTGNPVGAIAGGVQGALAGGGPSNAGNIQPSTDGTLAAQQTLDEGYEWAQLGLNAENMRHNLAMELQSTMFNEAEDEKSEQLREMNTLRDVAMKQREADIGILKEFIKTVKD